MTDLPQKAAPSLKISARLTAVSWNWICLDAKKQGTYGAVEGRRMETSPIPSIRFRPNNVTYTRFSSLKKEADHMKTTSSRRWLWPVDARRRILAI
jgi:hypothetical protein